jgi:hypothetical protein
LIKSFIFSVCEEEEAEEPTERRIAQTDEYYQERVRAPRFAADGELLRDTPKYDIDE